MNSYSDFVKEIKQIKSESGADHILNNLCNMVFNLEKVFLETRNIKTSTEISKLINFYLFPFLIDSNCIFDGNNQDGIVCPSIFLINAKKIKSLSESKYSDYANLLASIQEAIYELIIQTEDFE